MRIARVAAVALSVRGAARRAPAAPADGVSPVREDRLESTCEREAGRSDPPATRFEIGAAFGVYSASHRKSEGQSDDEVQRALFHDGHARGRWICIRRPREALPLCTRTSESRNTPDSLAF
jgi:hypothetical protein